MRRDNQHSHRRLALTEPAPPRLSGDPFPAICPTAFVVRRPSSPQIPSLPLTRVPASGLTGRPGEGPLQVIVVGTAASKEFGPPLAGPPRRP